MNDSIEYTPEREGEPPSPGERIAGSLDEGRYDSPGRGHRPDSTSPVSMRSPYPRRRSMASDRYLTDGLSPDELTVVYRALGFASLHLFPEPDLQAAAAKVYGKVRRIALARGLE